MPFVAGCLHGVGCAPFFQLVHVISRWCSSMYISCIHLEVGVRCRSPLALSSRSPHVGMRTSRPDRRGLLTSLLAPSSRAQVWMVQDHPPAGFAAPMPICCRLPARLPTYPPRCVRIPDGQVFPRHPGRPWCRRRIDEAVIMSGGGKPAAWRRAGGHFEEEEVDGARRMRKRRVPARRVPVSDR